MMTQAERAELARTRIRTGQATPEAVGFHALLYGYADVTWCATRWMGIPVEKSPLDLWVYQELIADLKPTVILETGSWHGGSALYFGHLCDLVGHGRVLSIDVRSPMQAPEALRPPVHPRVEYYEGSSVAPETLAYVRAFVQRHAKGGHVLVTLDSDHSPEHVAQELDAYTPFVTPRSYCVVEDIDCGDGETDVIRRPIINEQWAPRGGPGAALDRWLPSHPAWEEDVFCSHYLVTFHAWLKRLR